MTDRATQPGDTSEVTAMDADVEGGRRESAGELDQMVRLAEDVNRARSGQRQLMRRIAEAGGQKKRILIVDDDPGTRLLVSTTLGPQQYDIVEAERGTEALVLAQADPPALIILDVRMPDLDGIEVCRRVRSDPVLSEVPVVMLTAARDRAEWEAGMKAGANSYLTKPFSPLELLNVVEQFLEAKEV